MDAKELRIGNWCSDCEGCNYQVTALSILNMVNFSNGYNPCSISLTEEWLVKFGFIRDNKEILSLKENENEFIFFLEGNHVIIDKQQGQQLSGISIDCEYVHQLQNLYFALTGKELESAQIKKI
jgi:Fe-S cluster assembly iron-binding protein IscA